MLIPKKLLEQLNEKGVTVTHNSRTVYHNFIGDAYLFTKKSPLGREWKVEIGGGCPNWEYFVSAIKNYFLNFSSDDEAVALYNAHDARENGDRWSLQNLLDDMNHCYDGFVLLLDDLFSNYEYTQQDAYENLAYTSRLQFESAVFDTTARSQDKEKDLVTAILNRKPFFADCDGVSSLFTTYLVTEKVVDFLNGEKLTDKQKAFILAQENPVKELVKVTKHGFDYFMSEAFFNDVIPEALNMLMNSQSEENT